MRISEEVILAFQEKILTWYTVHQRDLPWRKSRDPYKILISEVMLQQTQVSRVIPKYERWLELFPTVSVLADVRVSEVLRAWSGLGYNRRALFLKRLAEVIMRDYGGVFPQDEQLLLRLPGIGKYTARAILCFAFDKQVAVVDTNVKKVILTQLGEQIAHFIVEEKSTYDKRQKSRVDNVLWEIAEELLSKGKAYDWNQALMDYASSVLKQEKISIPQQSKFAGSRRYYRGRLLKLLLEEHTISLFDISRAFNKEGEVEWVRMLVEDLQAEGFVLLQNGIVSLIT